MGASGRRMGNSGGRFLPRFAWKRTESLVSFALLTGLAGAKLKTPRATWRSDMVLEKLGDSLRAALRKIAGAIKY